MNNNNNKLHVLQRRVRADTNGSLRNHLLSIIEDSERIENVYNVIGNISIYANKRCGEWYINTNNIRNHCSCYFKSTDGHDQNISFSKTRLNLDVVINAVQNNGVLIIDSTRRGKQFPDSMRATIPIWISIINSIVLHKDDDDYIPKIDKSPTITKSHVALINSMLPDMIKSMPEGIINVIYETLHHILNLPLKPFWLAVEEDGEIEWFGEGVEEIVDQLGNIKIHELGYIPILMFSCSRVIQELLDNRVLSWTYIQGAGDDEENWACEGLTAQIFWSKKDTILQSDDPNEVELACKQCIHGFLKDRETQYDTTHDNEDKLPLGSISQIGMSGLLIFRYFLSSELALNDLHQHLHKALIKHDNNIYNETNINSIPMILMIESINDATKKTINAINKYNSTTLICYISFQKKNAMEQNNIWCNEIFPECIKFYNENNNTDIIVVSNDGILASVIATALICSKNDNNIDKQFIKSTMASIQSFASSSIIIPRRFNKFLNNYFLGLHGGNVEY